MLDLKNIGQKLQKSYVGKATTKEKKFRRTGVDQTAIDKCSKIREKQLTDIFLPLDSATMRLIIVHYSNRSNPPKHNQAFSFTQSVGGCSSVNDMKYNAKVFFPCPLDHGLI